MDESAEDTGRPSRSRAKLVVPLVLLLGAGAGLVAYLAASPSTPEYREVARFTSYAVEVEPPVPPSLAVQRCYSQRIINDFGHSHLNYLIEAQHWQTHRATTAEEWLRYAEHQKQKARATAEAECELVLKVAYKQLPAKELNEAAACCEAYAQDPFPSKPHVEGKLQ